MLIVIYVVLVIVVVVYSKTFINSFVYWWNVSSILAIKYISIIYIKEVLLIIRETKNKGARVQKTAYFLNNSLCIK